uniref:Uncharacterized protein n=1 Tax=Anguilla anguilla TaxID=7936 RepID=A0A0E9RG09_ANGAN
MCGTTLICPVVTLKIICRQCRPLQCCPVYFPS